LTLAEYSILPDVEFDIQQAARHLDHTAWSAIAQVEADVTARACAQLAPGRLASPADAKTSLVGLALRSIEGVLRFGRPSFGARDAAWALSVRQSDFGSPTTAEPDILAAYDAVLAAVHQLAPAAEDAARAAATTILAEAGVIAAQTAAPSPALLETPMPIPPLAFRGLADLPDVAYVVDRGLRFAYVNQAWETFARENDGATCLSQQVIGHPWLDAIGGPDRTHWLTVAEQILAGAIPSYREEIACHAPAMCRFLVVTASPLRLADDDLDVAGIVFITYDVTDLRRAESERLWLDREGRRARNVFVGTVAHDLRNPLTAIKGRAQLLRLRAQRAETSFQSSLQDSLDAIEATADQMAGQIDELLHVTQAQSGEATPLRARRTDLTALLTSVLAGHEHLLAGHRLHLDAPSEPVLADVDATQLRRVGNNLVSNAIKYSPDGGEIIVTLWSEHAGGQDWAVFSIQDQGIGIPAADLPSIFSGFFRGSNVDAEIGGFGLGLAGVHQIVTQHGGRIEVDGTVGTGTTFTVRLPLDAAPASSDRERTT
jgi:signal transduction histidine kinase